jgi:tryptophan halogenase
VLLTWLTSRASGGGHLELRQERDAVWKPYAELQLSGSGWQRTAGLQSARIVEWVGSTDIDWHKRDGEPTEPTIRHLRPGRREVFWQGNCLALGEAAGSAGPLVVSELHWACKALLLWLELYPARSNQAPVRREFNRRCEQILEAIRDFHLAHTLAYQPATEVRLHELPESLAWKLRLFMEQGRLWRNEEEAVTSETWFALLLGLGLTPARYDTVLDGVANEQLIATHQKIQAKLTESAQAMPTLHDVINRVSIE